MPTASFLRRLLVSSIAAAALCGAALAGDDKALRPGNEPDRSKQLFDGSELSQWVIEDHFAAGRPDWEEAGAELVSDVAPYEQMKLRLLNGAHSSLAYLGYLAGCETVSEAMANPDFERHIRPLGRRLSKHRARSGRRRAGAL